MRVHVRLARSSIIFFLFFLVIHFFRSIFTSIWHPRMHFCRALKKQLLSILLYHRHCHQLDTLWFTISFSFSFAKFIASFWCRIFHFLISPKSSIGWSCKSFFTLVSIFDLKIGFPLHKEWSNYMNVVVVSIVQPPSFSPAIQQI